MIQIILTAIVLYVAYEAVREIMKYVKQKLGKRSMAVFSGNYVEVKQFYVQQFGSVPCISFINNIDTSKVFDYISEGHAGKVLKIHQRNFYSWQRTRQEFSVTIFTLEGNIMIEAGDDYVEILFPPADFKYANDLMDVLVTYKSEGKEEDQLEINIITVSNNCLELKPLTIKATALDIDKYYNDDFKEIDFIIRERLKMVNDKGIILLHGLPGTGKTTYLRFLVGNLKKKVLFVSPAVAGNLMNPEFMDILIDNPNAVLVIEDAENIIMDRRTSNNSSVSNLLNISDGLLSDCLNVQVICTFNSELSLVDSALMRKGRLIARYEFGKLSVSKAQQLSDHLGLNQVIRKPMTLAEITNPEDKEFEIERTEVLGFRRKVSELN